ncbi:hypothetical protein E2C01_055521 [Portunus trituberculatus]|uniref:Uncharacterized protein n=1 Tax=Portunus trituberculatus TaxID=210409 RepID=A0A5B7GV84_PORTR|nr:hypothetical protein [Portunus trituberculatus]
MSVRGFTKTTPVASCISLAAQFRCFIEPRATKTTERLGTRAAACGAREGLGTGYIIVVMAEDR